MFKLIGILFLFSFQIGLCFGQKKEVDHVKRTEFKPSVSENDDSPWYKSEVNYSNYHAKENFNKTVGYASDSTLQRYSLEYYESEEGSERISMYYDFYGEGKGYLEIYHEQLDTLRAALTTISIQLDERTQKYASEFNVRDFASESDKTDYYEVPDSIVTRYITWITNDLTILDSMKTPDFFGSTNWKKRKSRENFGIIVRKGQSQTTTYFYVDTYFSESHIKIDTVLISEHHANLITDDSKTWSLSEIRTDTTLHHEEYTYFIENDSTYQVQYNLFKGDTLNRIFLSTVLIHDTLYSHYRIVGNPMDGPWNGGRNQYEHAKVLEREIWIKRDALGYIVNGHAKGIVVDDVQGNQHVECLIGVRIDEKNDKQRRMIQQPLYRGSSFPARVYVQTPRGTYLTEYDLVSFNPNFDLKPLLAIKRIDYDGVMIDPIAYPIKIRKRTHRLKRTRRSRYRYDYGRNTKRVEVNRKNKYERWESKSAFDNVVYEVFFK